MKNEIERRKRDCDKIFLHGCTGTNSTSCGPINKDRGIQRLEAMLFAIDKINDDAQLLKNIKLGAIILDTCSSDTYALNQSLEFIRASINTVEASAFECSDGAMPRSKYGWKHITGVVGGSYSEVSCFRFHFAIQKPNPIARSRCKWRICYDCSKFRK